MQILLNSGSIKYDKNVAPHAKSTRVDRGICIIISKFNSHFDIFCSNFIKLTLLEGLDKTFILVIFGIQILGYHYLAICQQC